MKVVKIHVLVTFIKKKCIKIHVVVTFLLDILNIPCKVLIPVITSIM